jgi:predicted Zn-dependent protease
MGIGKRRADAHVVMRVGLAAVVALLALGVVSSAAGERTAADTTAASRPVLFVPLGGFPRSEATALARYVRAKVGVRTGVLGAASIPRSAYDAKRKQYVAERLIARVGRPSSEPSAVMIGLTAEDMYIKSEPWRFGFSLRSPQGFAVVSRARMDPRVQGLNPDPGLRMRRLQKMVLKNVGALSLGLPLSGNPRSAMSKTILSVDDLDYMTDDFRPAKPSGARRTWLARSDRACKQATTREKAFVAGAPLATQEDFLAFMRELIRLRDQARTELAAVPAWSGDRAQVQALLARVKRSLDADRKAVAKLEAQWSDAAAEAWALANARAGFALRASALELGSLGCAGYFDPQT